MLEQATKYITSTQWCVPQDMGKGSARGWVCLGDDKKKYNHVTKGQVTVSSSGEVIGPEDEGP